MPARTPTILALAGLLLSSGAALTQGNPSADSIINSLRPHAGMTGGTRGIRPIGPSESAVPATPSAPAAIPRAGTPVASPGTRPAAPPPRPSATAEPSAPSVNLTVQFANNSAELTPAATHTLDELGRALSSQALSAYRFRIEGHTDALGTHEHNQALSEQRANRVVDYLVNKFGVDKSRVEAVGMGEDRPLVPARANVPEPRNRRVMVINLGS
jgi:outer membrane protein OmpA-like peptidoglycan-associated protein